MQNVINATTLRVTLQSVIRRVQKGKRYTLLYRGRPVCEIVPVNRPLVPVGPLEDDPLYQAKAFGASTDGRTAADHDDVLYGWRR